MYFRSAAVFGDLVNRRSSIHFLLPLLASSPTTTAEPGFRKNSPNNKSCGENANLSRKFLTCPFECVGTLPECLHSVNVRGAGQRFSWRDVR